MKFAIIVLLGLCAFASAQDSFEDNSEISPLRSEILDTVHEKINELIKKITSELDVIGKKVKEIAENVRASLVSFGQQTKDKLHGLKSEAVAKIQELILKGGDFKKCAEALIPEYEKVEKEARSDFHSCANDVETEYKRFSKLIADDIEGVKAEVEKFNEEVKECLSWNIIAFIKCAKAKMDEFESVFKGIKASAEDAIIVARDSAGKIVSEVRVCNGALLKKASSQVSVLNNKLAQCYKQ